VGILSVKSAVHVSTFLAQYLPAKPGPIIDVTTGEQVGAHDGLWTYTIGQGAKIRGMPEKMHVSHKDVTANTVYVVPGT
jgi:tRNA U34 2-thiouridine synthase MnmA/TrmU